MKISAKICRKFANITGSWFNKQIYFNISGTFWKIKLTIPWANIFFSESQFAVLDLVIEKKIFFKISWKSVRHLILLLKPNQTKLTNDVFLFTRLAAHGQTSNKTWRYLLQHFASWINLALDKTQYFRNFSKWYVLCVVAILLKAFCSASRIFYRRTFHSSHSGKIFERQASKKIPEIKRSLSVQNLLILAIFRLWL